MHEKPTHGLSRRQLEYELRWLLRQQPSEPAKLVEFLGDVVVTLIEKNNAALERCAARDTPADPPSAVP